jgi:hypothetical protein
VVAALGIVGCVGYVCLDISRVAKQQLVGSERLSDSFAVLECERGSCSRGMYIASNTSAEKPIFSITTLPVTAVNSITAALNRSPHAYMVSGRVTLHEIGQCNHLLRDRAGEFYSVQILFPEEVPSGGVPQAKSVEELAEKECLLRLRVMNSSKPQNPLLFVSNALDQVGFWGTRYLWNYL